MKILVIDDHLIVREGLAALLVQAQPGTVIVHARDAAEGLAQAEAERDIDAVFLDLNLSGASAMSAIREFAARFPGLPVIILSSSESPADVRRALSLGALGYVPKSASPQTLVSALKLVLSGNIYLPPLMLDDPSRVGEDIGVLHRPIMRAAKLARNSAPRAGALFTRISAPTPAWPRRS